MRPVLAARVLEDLHAQLVRDAQQPGVEILEVVPEHARAEEQPGLRAHVLAEEDALGAGLRGQVDLLLVDPGHDVVQAPQLIGVERQVGEVDLHLAQVAGIVEDPAADVGQLELVGRLAERLGHVRRAIGMGVVRQRVDRRAGANPRWRA